MSSQKSTEISNKLKEAALIIVRAKQGKLTDSDKKILLPYLSTGAQDRYDEWLKASEIYLNKLKQLKDNELAILLDNGMLFDFQENQSAAPNQLLRGKLFAPIAKGRRKLIEDVVLVTSDDGLTEFKYSGAQLDQSDLDVLLTLLRVLGDASLTGNITKISDENGRHEYTRVRFSRYGFLKELKKNNQSKNYKNLDASLRRLGGELEITIKDTGNIRGPIVGKRFVDEATGDMVVDINQDFTTLFKNDQFAFIDMSERLQLKNGFEKWLHGFVLTHSGESFYSAEKLMELSGSNAKRIRQWMQRQATPAFEKLAGMEVIFNFQIDGHLYTWTR